MSRRIGRSQNGEAGGWSFPPVLWLPLWLAWLAGGALDVFSAGAEFGCARPLDRCLAPAVGQPLAGQAGPEPDGAAVDPPDPPDRPRTGGPDPPASGPGAPDLDRVPGAADRPAPRDQPEAGALMPGAARPGAGVLGAGVLGAGGLDPAGPGVPVRGAVVRDVPLRAAPVRGVPLRAPPERGGRSSGGATRPLALSASLEFLSRAEPAPPAALTSLRELPPLSPLVSTGGGASARSRAA